MRGGELGLMITPSGDLSKDGFDYEELKRNTESADRHLVWLCIHSTVSSTPISTVRRLVKRSEDSQLRRYDMKPTMSVSISLVMRYHAF